MTGIIAKGRVEGKTGRRHRTSQLGSTSSPLPPHKSNSGGNRSHKPRTHQAPSLCSISLVSPKGIPGRAGVPCGGELFRLAIGVALVILSLGFLSPFQRFFFSSLSLRRYFPFFLPFILGEPGKKRNESENSDIPSSSSGLSAGQRF